MAFQMGSQHEIDEALRRTAERYEREQEEAKRKAAQEKAAQEKDK